MGLASQGAHIGLRRLRGWQKKEASKREEKGQKEKEERLTPMKFLVVRVDLGLCGLIGLLALAALGTRCAHALQRRDSVDQVMEYVRRECRRDELIGAWRAKRW
jgi:hypothetical protein